jgi:hypothetical protein
LCARQNDKSEVQAGFEASGEQRLPFRPDVRRAAVVFKKGGQKRTPAKPWAAFGRG